MAGVVARESTMARPVVCGRFVQVEMIKTMNKVTAFVFGPGAQCPNQWYAA